MRSHRRHAGTNGGFKHCAAAAIGVRADTGFAALAVAMGSLAACLCPGERWRCAGVFTAGCTVGALAAPVAAGALPLAVSAGVA
ncbi:MAG: hypothetical protein ACLUFT_09885 [Gemmiger formicilis]|uniref:hypothetical protein n=1 Tax=Gemmiger formicilis TaxID=745368 RepID=UPI00399688F9